MIAPSTEEKDKKPIMITNETYQMQDAAQTLTKSLRETNQTIADSAVAAQERNVAFAQITFENGIEVLKSHAEGTRSLTRVLAEEPQAAFQTLTDSVLSAQERNIKFAQSIYRNWTEVTKSHAEGTRSLAQSLTAQTRKQQEAWQALAQESLKASIGFFSSPLAYYQETFGIVESATRQGLEHFQKVTNQAFDSVQKATQQTVATVQEAGQ